MARAKNNPLITDFNHIPAEALVPEEEQPYPLPEHWKWVRLGTTVKNITAKTESFDAADKYLGLEDLNTGGGILRISDTNGIKSAKTVFQYGDVLYGKLRPYLNKHAVANFSGVCSTDILALRPERIIDAAYLDFWLSTPFFLNAAITNSKGVNLPRVSFNSIARYPFPLPPIEEQKQIVAYLDEKLGKIDSVRGKLQDFLDHADQRKDNLIEAGVTGHLTSHWREDHNAHLKDWQLKQISDLGEVVTGSTPSTRNPEYYGGEFPFVKPADLDAGRYIKSAQSFLSQAGAKVSRMLPAKTVAVCCIGSLGKCGLIEVPAATNQQINSIIPRSGTHAVYLYYLCSSPKFKAAMIEKSSSTTLSILNKSRFSKLKFSIPTMGEQEEIARILDEQLERAERTDRLVAEVLERLDTMKQQIVSAALAGRLSLQVS